MSMKSKLLGALALLTLIGALFVMQSAEQQTPTADAAVGSIAALNVGTCLTTDATVFKGDCDELSNDEAGTDNDWEVRDKITEVPTLYATYAHDPKTASNEPRAILEDSDLLKISITDADRDRRDGVLIAGATPASQVIGDDDAANTLAQFIRDDLDKLQLDYETQADADASDPDTDERKEDIKLTHAAASATVIHIQGTPSSSVIADSGNITLNFARDATNGEPFKPADFDVDDGAVVRFYGCAAATDLTTCDLDESVTGESNDLQVLSDYLNVDEDASNGEAAGATAPWLGVNASVPSDSDIVILAIYYRTSNIEDLVGGETYRECSGTGTPSETNDKWDCPNSQDVVKNDGEFDVDFTNDEKSDNDALMVRATADGSLEERSVNLHLRETGRFDGVYQGYLRLTDDNGDGRDAKSDPKKDDILNWGHQVGNGKGMAGEDENDEQRRNDAAVLAVESGPVTIEYQDTDGRKRTLRIEIDNQVPTINVTSPSHGSASGDQTPDFAGTLEDTESGLVDGSFRLVVDNKVDDNGAEGKNSNYALDGKAPNASEVMLSSGLQATGIEDYAGYNDDENSDPTQFGVVGASALYNLGDDACDDGHPVCHILSDSYDDGATSGGFDDSLRLDLYSSPGEALDVRDKEFEIDFQAFVMDMAGNIGFSDSDPSNPRFINDLGEKEADRQEPLPNVLGYYSAHIITLDEKDPVVMTDESATGYYGRADKKLVADRTGIVIVFDGPVAESSVSTSTFTVELDDKSMAPVTEVDVDGKYVFLKLGSELASDATPKIGIATGEKVEDMAGNETFGRELDAFDANDGISPRLTVTLSGGSGTGTGSEGPEKLTKDRMTVHVSSDEALQGSPEVAVVCSSLEWHEGDVEKDIDDYIANRNTASPRKPSEDPTPQDATSKNEEYRYTCGYQDEKLLQDYDPDDGSRALARPGDNWEHTWQNPTGPSQMLRAGKVTVVAFASDRSRFKKDGVENVRNWGATSAEFVYDNVAPTEFDLQPERDGVSKEDRPFVLIEFNDSHSVTLDSVELDSTEISGEFEMPQMNRFVYWPQSLAQGEHEVEYEVTDAAGNEATGAYKFTVEARGKFLLELQAGWNAVSVPANPVDTAIGSVFTDPAVTTVIGWDTQGWRIAVQRDGVWESNQKYGALNDIQARYGYWVKSDKFIDQPVALRGPISRNAGSPGTPIGIDTIAGWNFVGVVDQDGDQTEDNFGESLKAGNAPQSAADYLGSNYVRAYSWDPTFSRFINIARDDAMTIGQGVWVYYEGGIAP